MDLTDEQWAIVAPHILHRLRPISSPPSNPSIYMEFYKGYTPEQCVSIANSRAVRKHCHYPSPSPLLRSIPPSLCVKRPEVRSAFSTMVSCWLTRCIENNSGRLRWFQVRRSTTISRNSTNPARIIYGVDIDTELMVNQTLRLLSMNLLHQLIKQNRHYFCFGGESLIGHLYFVEMAGFPGRFSVRMIYLRPLPPKGGKNCAPNGRRLLVESSITHAS